MFNQGRTFSKKQNIDRNLNKEKGRVGHEGNTEEK